MKREADILIAENNKEHFELIRKNLLRAGISNNILHFTDGQEILDFLFDKNDEPEGERGEQEYILLLDISISELDGVAVLEKIRQDAKLKGIPVIILTAVDDQPTIERCYNLGCSTYIVKPTEQKDFEETIQKIGYFLSIIEMTSIK